jgi:type II secretory pathway component GspD/PulD (secretin)
MVRHVLAFTLLALAAVPLTGQERPAEPSQRLVYLVKYAASKDLADVLAKHFKDVASFQAVPEGTSNCLLVSAPRAVMTEVLKTLEQLDRRPQSVAVDVFIVELLPKTAGDVEKRPDEQDLSGTIDDVAKRLRALMARGQATRFRRIQLTALEGQVGSLTLQNSMPFVTGTARTGAGRVSSTFIYRNVGTDIKVTPRVTTDTSVMLDLSVRDSRGRASTTVTVGNDDKGNPMPATEFIETVLNGKVRVPSGKAVLVKDAKVTSKEGEGETLIVVGARVAEGEAKTK